VVIRVPAQNVEYHPPANLPQLLKNSKAIQAMMGMKKMDIAELERAANS
jgi:hypothetical protein